MPAATILLPILATFACALPGQSSRQQVENLRAFTKAYGYVKYFHPSEEAAQVDWSRFATLGAARVKACKDETELRETLTTLFAPLAPSARFHGTSESANLPKLEFADDAVVAWQHLGVSLDSGGQDNIYKSVRVNRPIGPRAKVRGGVHRTMPAKDLAGKRIRFSGQARAEGSEKGCRAAPWLLVHLENGKQDFFEQASIPSPQWDRYQIDCALADTAATVYLGLGVAITGSGMACFDDVQLEVETDGQWTPVPLSDPGFEQAVVGETPKGWVVPTMDTRAYLAAVEATGAAAGNQCLVIRTVSGQQQPIFADLPKAGEVATKTIASGLLLSFPLTLPVSGAPVGSNFDSLRQTLEAMPEPTVDQQEVRLGHLVSAWNVFQHFYPYFDVVETDWDAALTKALERGLRDTTPAEHRVTLQKLVAELRDGHGAVQFKDAEQGDLPARFDWIEDHLVVTAVAPGCPFQRGDVVVSVDGVSAAAVIEEVESRVSGSDALRRHRALNVVGYGVLNTVANVVVRRGGEEKALAVQRVKPLGNLYFRSLSEFEHEPFLDLGDGHYYIQSHGLENARFQELLPTLVKAKGLIVDQRLMVQAKEPWRLIDLIPHLAKEPTTSARWMPPQVIRPDREGTTFAESRWPPTPPCEPHCTARVLIINVPSVVSYGESVMGIFEHYKLAEFVGEPTAGCNGNMNFHVLPGGILIMWTGMKVLKHDGSRHHLVGIQPTHPVTRTIEAVEAGRDEYLEKAIALLKGK